MKEDEIEGKKPSPFDLYFDSCEDGYIIKLYEVPKIPGRKTSKEWIEDFENEKPSEEYIAAFYGAGHYWVMGTDKDGKIKSKDIHISDRAVQRIQKRKGIPPAVANSGVPGLAGGGDGQGIDSVVSLLDKLMTSVITPLITAQQKPASPIAQLEEYQDKMLSMFQRNMETMNAQIMGFSKKLANQNLQVPEPKQDGDSKSSWVKDLIPEIKPYIDKFLDANGMMAEMYKQEMQQQPKFKSMLQDDKKLNELFDGLADDPSIGEEKALELFQKWGFTPIYDNPPEQDANNHVVNNEAASKTD